MGSWPGTRGGLARSALESLNLVAIVLLGKWAFAAIRDHQRQAGEGRDPVFVAAGADLPGILEGDIWEPRERGRAEV